VRELKVFLFDEPLSNLDAQLRVELKRLHQNLKNTMIYVTHDQIEAMTLADRIAIMRHGVIQQLGNPSDIYNRPSNLYVAGFIGSPPMNFLSGRLENNRFTGTFIADTSGCSFAVPYSGETVFGIRPEHIAVGESVKIKPIQMEVIVEVVEPMGADTVVWSSIDGEPLCIRMDGQISIGLNERLMIGIDPAQGLFFDKNSGNRL